MSTQDSVADLVGDIHKLYKSLEEAQNAASSYHEMTRKCTKGAVTATLNLTEKDWTKICKTLKDTKSSISKLEKSCTTCLDKLGKVESERKKRNNKDTKNNHPSVGAKRFKGDSSFSVAKGRQVAARISKDKDLPEEWILAAVVNYDEHKQLYEVEDEDPGDESDPEPFRRHYFLPCHRIIPLPEEGKYKDIPRGTEVLSMFPATTSFYKAIVEQPPKGKKNPDFVVKFDDDDDETGETPLRKVKPKFVVLRADVAKS